MRTCVSQPEDKREIISLRGIERLKLKFRGSTCSESSVAPLRRRTNSHKCFSHVRSVQVRAIGVIWMSIDGRKLWRFTANRPLWYLPFPLFFLIQVEFRLILGDLQLWSRSRRRIFDVKQIKTTQISIFSLLHCLRSTVLHVLHQLSQKAKVENDNFTLARRASPRMRRVGFTEQPYSLYCVEIH